ncbi:hypothetical protein GDO81_024248 [Engystomops pustulosus]|uniref:Uncharacterized protein n=1 Tax=Engystomops pustulosus TaxID=76066 RepID=A0AAV6YUA8_ENGPU|nr:hypothetical protein GDO81_024248 [Engystomops pustulosus]
MASFLPKSTFSIRIMSLKGSNGVTRAYRCCRFTGCYNEQNIHTQCPALYLSLPVLSSSSMKCRGREICSAHCDSLWHYSTKGLWKRSPEPYRLLSTITKVDFRKEGVMENK